MRRKLGAAPAGPGACCWAEFAAPSLATRRLIAYRMIRQRRANNPPSLAWIVHPGRRILTSGVDSVAGMRSIGVVDRPTSTTGRIRVLLRWVGAHMVGAAGMTDLGRQAMQVMEELSATVSQLAHETHGDSSDPTTIDVELMRILTAEPFDPSDAAERLVGRAYQD